MFLGQYYDQETGTHYNYFRDYNPNIGRYNESDPIGLRGGWNTFTYVGANPLVFYDSLGLSPNDIKIIQKIINDTGDKLTNDGKRWPNSPHYNNMCAWYPFLPYCSGKELDCGGQASELLQSLDDAQNTKKFDDPWLFIQDGAWAHMWVGGVNRSNPNEWFTADLRSGKFQIGGICETCSGAFGQKGNDNDRYNIFNKDKPFKPQAGTGNTHH